MTQQGPATTRVAPPEGRRERDRSGAPVGLTRAEAHALRRSAPLTPALFRQQRGLAEDDATPLRHI